MGQYACLDMDVDNILGHVHIRHIADLKMKIDL